MIRLLKLLETFFPFSAFPSFWGSMLERYFPVFDFHVFAHDCYDVVKVEAAPLFHEGTNGQTLGFDFKALGSVETGVFNDSPIDKTTYDEDRIYDTKRSYLARWYQEFLVNQDWDSRFFYFWISQAWDTLPKVLSKILSAILHIGFFTIGTWPALPLNHINAHWVRAKYVSMPSQSAQFESPKIYSIFSSSDARKLYQLKTADRFPFQLVPWLFLSKELFELFFESRNSLSPLQLSLTRPCPIFPSTFCGVRDCVIFDFRGLSVLPWFSPTFICALCFAALHIPLNLLSAFRS